MEICISYSIFFGSFIYFSSLGIARDKISSFVENIILFTLHIGENPSIIFEIVKFLKTLFVFSKKIINSGNIPCTYFI